MNRLRDIRDYATLAEVRRRRGLALQQELMQAQAEHDRCVRRRADSEAELRARVSADREYADKITARTARGRGVRLDELQGARGHGETLQAACQDARHMLAQATDAVDVALSECARVRAMIAANSARVQSLEAQVHLWKQALAMASEDREEDERADSPTRLLVV